MNQDFFSYGINDVMAQATATGLFTSFITIQAPDGLLGPSGAPSGTFADIPGLVDIPCIDAPSSFTSVDVTEIKALMEIESKGNRHILLDAYYQIIETGWREGWRAVLNGVVYDILGAEQSDSQALMTRMELRLVTV